MARTKNTAAAAHICGSRDHPQLCGTVHFLPRREGTLVVADVHGLPDSETGFFAFHIHEGDNCRGDAFPNTGGHYNPYGADHPCHAGDLPPLLSVNGRAYCQVLTGRFCVNDIIGKTVVIHSSPDDFTTQPSGNAGSKIACGVICRT